MPKYQKISKQKFNVVWSYVYEPNKTHIRQKLTKVEMVKLISILTSKREAEVAVKGISITEDKDN